MEFIFPVCMGLGMAAVSLIAITLVLIAMGKVEV